jgi:hypothetical protein
VSSQFAVLVLNDELITWLTSIGKMNSSLDYKSRYPTYLELLSVVENLRNMKLEIYDYRDIGIVFQLSEVQEMDPSRWAEIVIPGYSINHEDGYLPKGFYFGRSGQEELENEIMKELVEICGPLVLLRDYDNPEIFYPKGLLDN